jgi:hypothetical protein
VNLSYSSFWWLMVSAVIAGIATTKILSGLWDLAFMLLAGAGRRLWAHLSRR